MHFSSCIVLILFVPLCNGSVFLITSDDDYVEPELSSQCSKISTKDDYIYVNATECAAIYYDGICEREAVVVSEGATVELKPYNDGRRPGSISRCKLGNIPKKTYLDFYRNEDSKDFFSRIYLQHKGCTLISPDLRSSIGYASTSHCVVLYASRFCGGISSIHRVSDLDKVDLRTLFKGSRPSSFRVCNLYEVDSKEFPIVWLTGPLGLTTKYLHEKCSNINVDLISLILVIEVTHCTKFYSCTDCACAPELYVKHGLKQPWNNRLSNTQLQSFGVCENLYENPKELIKIFGDGELVVPYTADKVCTCQSLIRYPSTFTRVQTNFTCVNLYSDPFCKTWIASTPTNRFYDFNIAKLEAPIIPPFQSLRLCNNHIFCYPRYVDIFKFNIKRTGDELSNQLASNTKFVSKAFDNPSNIQDYSSSQLDLVYDQSVRVQSGASFRTEDKLHDDTNRNKGPSLEDHAIRVAQAFGIPGLVTTSKDIIDERIKANSKNGFTEKKETKSTIFKFEVLVAGCTNLKVNGRISTSENVALEYEAYAKIKFGKPNNDPKNLTSEIVRTMLPLPLQFVSIFDEHTVIAKWDMVLLATVGMTTHITANDTDIDDCVKYNNSNNIIFF